MNKNLLFALIFLVPLFSFAQKAKTPFVTEVPVIDGSGDELLWVSASWQPINQVWLGAKPKPEDFSGRFKVVAGPAGIYVLAEITDDTLMDQYHDPSSRYWDDDCLEIFLDPDASGGDHQYNHNAYAFHMGIYGDVYDLGVDKKPLSMNDHVTFKRTTVESVSVWEVWIRPFDHNYIAFKKGQEPMVLAAGQTVGFGIAYCDNDSKPERENFVGSFPIPGPDTNRGWKNASLFSKVKFTVAGAAPTGPKKK